MSRYIAWTMSLAISVSAACSSASPGIDPVELVGAPEDTASEDQGLKSSVPVGSSLVTTTDVNFRKGPGTSYSVIRVLAKGTKVEVVVATPSNKFYNVRHQGTVGWVHGAYLEIVQQLPGTTASRTSAISRAKSSVSFSYWWGHGRWRPEGPTSSTKGSCAGSCPNCTHSGAYGADCSGLVAKVWQVPSSNDDVTVDMHQYSTADFDSDTSQWKSVSRGVLLPADGLVYRASSSGHVVVYESGDGWGNMWLYECKGCSAGCVHNLRSLGSSYHGIRRSGY